MSSAGLAKSEPTSVTLQLPALHAGQQAILREAKRFNVVRCGRRFGKTVFGEVLAIDPPALGGYPVGWFAPTHKILSDAWREILVLTEPIIAKKDEQDHRVEFITGGAIDFWSLDDARTPGRGRKYKRVVVDEAGFVRHLQDAWLGAIRPTLTDFRGDAWFLGTPHGRGYFDQLYRRGQAGEEGWASWQRGTVDNPHIDPAEVEAARREMPPEAFAQEYLGIPADNAANPFGLERIAACAIDGLSSQPVVAWGIDLAKSHDWTVCIGLDAEGWVCRFERWQASWADTVRRIRELVGTSPALVDCTGVGDPVLEQLQADASTNFEGFRFTSQTKQQLMERLAMAIHQGRVSYPRGPITNELEVFEYVYTPTGVRYSGPSGFHDDCVCALALAVTHQQQFGALGRTGTGDDIQVW